MGFPNSIRKKSSAHFMRFFKEEVAWGWEDELGNRVGCRMKNSTGSKTVPVLDEHSSSKGSSGTHEESSLGSFLKSEGAQIKGWNHHHKGKRQQRGDQVDNQPENVWGQKRRAASEDHRWDWGSKYIPKLLLLGIAASLSWLAPYLQFYLST